MSLVIYNTLTRQKEIFKPREDNKIGLYVCGMTIYDFCHIGHARLLIAFDVVTRFLRSQQWQVNYVRNITDIDDKILTRAKENNEAYTNLTERFIDTMHQDEASLNILPPDQEPRATQHIDEIIELIATLIEKDFAYKAANNDVYYRVRNFTDYGKLTNNNLDDMLIGARIAVDEAKEDPRDFALWKSAEEAEAGWLSPWGYGRPGWHIECSAMSKKCLGDTFDIHGGGPDLPFPHHENEIAQSEAANDCAYANYWMHAGAVRLDGEKMSKSLGNFFTIRDVLEKYHPEVIRYLLVGSHYRSPINYSDANLVEAKSGLDRFYSALRKYEHLEISEAVHIDNEHYQKFVAAMNDDFNTPVALASMFDLVRELNSIDVTEQKKALIYVGALKAMGAVLGVLQSDPTEYLQSGSLGQMQADEIEALINERIEAKAAKNYSRADEIRKILTEACIVVEDSSSGTQWRREV